jgi:ATP-dependent protease HslVU (ClpYQ) peptidase subunit
MDMFSLTCIVGLVKNGKIVMGADCCAADEDSFIVAKNTKIFRKKGMIIGCADSFRVINIINYMFVPPDLTPNYFEYMIVSFVPELQKSLEKNKVDCAHDDFGMNLLVGIDDMLFEIQSDFSITFVPSWGTAIGSGGNTARGSLFTTKDMKLSGSQKVLKALEAAEACILNVKGPFEILEN